MIEATLQPGGPTTSRRPLGQGDCERWQPVGVGQPTNTATSAALVLGGLWVMQRARSVGSGQWWRPLGYGALLAAAGLGSVAYHGLGGTCAERAHDRSMEVLVLATVLGEVERAVHRSQHRAAATAEPPATLTATDGPSRADPGHDRRPRTAGVVALAAALAAPIAYALGRTSATTCRPESRWQWHGLWHVLAALAGTAWAERTQVLPHVTAGPLRAQAGLRAGAM